MANYELLRVEGGIEYRRYENGDIRDQNGRLLERPERIKAIEITPETSLEMVKRRKEKMLKAVEDGVIAATKAPDVHAAVSRIVARRAEVALSNDGQPGNDAAKMILAALDALPERRAEVVNVQRHVYEVDPETVKVIEEMMRRRRDGDIIDVEVE